jgi:rhodanese-related sulfurtransferase
MKRCVLLAAVFAAGLAGSAQVGRGEECATACAPKPAGDAAKTEQHAYGILDSAALKALVTAKTPMVLVDARTPKWDDGRRIPGALYVPADSDDDAIAKALPDKNALIVAYCTNLKCPASKMLAEKLVKSGYKNVMKYPDGLEGWIAAGNAVTEAPKKE